MAIEQAARTPKNILWVEDEEAMEHLVLQRMRSELREGRFQFTFAPNIQTAKELLSHWPGPVPLVLCDINLPDGNGLDLLKMLTDMHGTEAVVIMVTAYDDMATIRNAMQNGAFDFVTKPIDFPDLVKTIHRALEFQEIQHSLKSERKALVRMEQEMEFARNIQNGLLTIPEIVSNIGSAFSVAAAFVPAGQLSGVMYDYRKTADGRLVIFMANVSGSGLSGALHMAKVHSVIDTLLVSTKVDTAGKLLAQINRVLCAHNNTGHFVTCFLGLLSPGLGHLNYVCAGHRPPMIAKPNGIVVSLERTGDMALGVKDSLIFQEQNYMMAPEDSLLVFNHGAAEVRNGGGKVFGDDGVKRIFAESVSIASEGEAPLEEIIDSVVKGLRNFAGGWQLGEDVAFIALRGSAGGKTAVPVR